MCVSGKTNQTNQRSSSSPMILSGGRDGAEIGRFERIIGDSRIYSSEIQNGKSLQSIKAIFDGYDIHYFWTTYAEETEDVMYE